jgi:hypothetical protein
MDRRVPLMHTQQRMAPVGLISLPWDFDPGISPELAAAVRAAMEKAREVARLEAMLASSQHAALSISPRKEIVDCCDTHRGDVLLHVAESSLK